MYIDSRTVIEHRSLLWHISRDTGPRFLQSRPKDCPIWLLSSIRHYIVGKHAIYAVSLLSFLSREGSLLCHACCDQGFVFRRTCLIYPPFSDKQGVPGPYLTRLIKLKIITIACTCTYYAMYCDFLGLLLATWLLLQL